MQWLRLYHDTPTDPKWRLVAAESGQSEAIVLAIWIHMMVNASQGKQRGVLEDWDDRIIAASMGLRGDIVAAVRSAMQGIVLDGDRLTGWDKRQRTSDSAAERMKKSRARKAATPNGDGGGGGSPNSQNEPEAPLKSNGAHLSYRNGAVTGSDSHVTEHLENVTEHSEDVTKQPLRAQTPDSQKEDSGASAPATEVADAPLKSQLFGACRIWLGQASGRAPNKLRGMIGRWIAAHGEGAVLMAFVQAQREDAIEPIGFIEKVLGAGGNGKQGHGSKHDRLINGLAGAFGDLLDPRSEDSSGGSREVARRYH